MQAWHQLWGWGGAGRHCLLGISADWVMLCPCSTWGQYLALPLHWADAGQVPRAAHALFFCFSAFPDFFFLALALSCTSYKNPLELWFCALA